MQPSMQFGLRRKKADVLSHWFVVLDGFRHSTSDFYGDVEKELAERKVPGLTMSRVDFAEGGLLSDKRVYLRMLRERLVFDVCAAPFGRAYFFSLRFAEIPAKVALWELFVCFVGLAVILGVLFRYTGVILGLCLFCILLGGVIYVARNAVGFGLQDLDASLIKLPVVGPIYERFIRKETYYRHDTRLLYHTIVSEVVKKKIEEVTAAKGVKFIEMHEFSPILGELYKPTTVQLEPRPTPAPATA
ncbi:MAG: hypothetical protein HZA93_18685 [Verrucomicrobia bacterium]|nr:hypothetical protein [Verrucomicrobiota bacterium]